MSTAVVASPQPRVLADLVPRVRARDLALVLAAVVLTSLCAQISFYLPGNPVPVTGQTFAVLLCSAALGANRGTVSMLLYLLVGIIGLPVFADGNHGLDILTGASGGYLVGFLLASWVVGKLSEHRYDRRVPTAVPLFLAGSALIYAIGVPWLAISTEQSIGWAISNGFVDFIPGDLVKAAAAAGLLPLAWKIAGRRH